MSTLDIRAHAKINLTLDIVGKRPDGYHELQTVMQSLALCDDLALSLQDTPVFSAGACLPGLPGDTRNLALAAAKLFLTRTGRAETGASIAFTKRIPISAGLGGGSADAAAVLRALNERFGAAVDEPTLMTWALELGSDVPYCLYGKTALAEGRGERLTHLPPLPQCAVLLCKPPFSVSTREAFAGVNVARGRTRPDIRHLREALEKGDLGAVARCMYNVFEAPLALRHLSLGHIRSVMIDGGALGAIMSGSGPTMFGLFDRPGAAKAAFDTLRKEFPTTILTETV